MNISKTHNLRRLSFIVQENQLKVKLYNFSYHIPYVYKCILRIIYLRVILCDHNLLIIEHRSYLHNLFQQHSTSHTLFIIHQHLLLHGTYRNKFNLKLNFIHNNHLCIHCTLYKHIYIQNLQILLNYYQINIQKKMKQIFIVCG